MAHYTYRNGNTITSICSDGTKIRFTMDDEFNPAFADNIDIKITNQCDACCPWCHEGSGRSGKHADILNQPFWNTIHEYQEVALGGGNILTHPDFYELLFKLNDLKVITNITLNQYHFQDNFDYINSLMANELVHGVGISLITPTVRLCDLLRRNGNFVLHVINGVFNERDFDCLCDNDLKILILGYKELRRGKDFISKYPSSIKNNQQWLATNLDKMINSFKLCSFDCLAFEQLGIKKFVTEKYGVEYLERMYSGDDGSHTFFIDAVNEQFSVSSTSPENERFSLLDNVDDMFNKIRK